MRVGASLRRERWYRLLYQMALGTDVKVGVIARDHYEAKMIVRDALEAAGSKRQAGTRRRTRDGKDTALPGGDWARISMRWYWVAG